VKEVLISKEDMRDILVSALRDRLTNEYSSPAREVVNKVMAEVSPEFEAVLKDVLKEVVLDDEFKNQLRIEFRHKVAKLLVGELSGSVDKAVNSFRQDPRLKAQMIQAIDSIISPVESDTQDS